MADRVQAVIDALTRERLRFAAFARSLDDEERARPVPGSEWMVAEFIRHVATLDAAYAGWFGALAGDGDREPHRGSAGFDVDRFNAAAVAELGDRDLEAVLAVATERRADVVRALRRLDDGQLDQMVRFGGDRKRPPVELPLIQLLGGWARHDAIHVADMLKALPERRADPTLTVWLGEPDAAAAIGRYQAAMG